MKHALQLELTQDAGVLPVRQADHEMASDVAALVHVLGVVDHDGIGGCQPLDVRLHHGDLPSVVADQRDADDVGHVLDGEQRTAGLTRVVDVPLDLPDVLELASAALLLPARVDGVDDVAPFVRGHVVVQEVLHCAQDVEIAPGVVVQEGRDLVRRDLCH